MAFGVVGAIVEAMMNGPEGMDYANISYAPLDPVTWKIGGERTLQYWPETLSDTIDIGWNFKDIAGASSSLAQWGSNNGRTFTFEVHFHRFMKPVASRSKFDDILDPIKLNVPNTRYLKDNRPHNVNIPYEIRGLRALCYPSYTKDKQVQNILNASPPPIMILNVPGLQLNETGQDFVFCVMTGCDVNYILSFPNGEPRRASVSITLRQIVQLKSGVKFVGLSPDSPIQFNKELSEKQIGKGGGHKGNLIEKMSDPNAKVKWLE